MDQSNKCEGTIKAATGGGTIDLNQIDGVAQIQSGGGGIKIGPIRSGMHVETGSGPIIATLAKGSSFLIHAWKPRSAPSSFTFQTVWASPLRLRSKWHAEKASAVIFLS